MRRDVIERLRPLAGGVVPEIGERALYKCEYCDKDMLASVDNYISWEHDHIIPKAAGGEDTLDNLALSCHNCNVLIKKAWNPVDQAGENASREELIAAVRNYIEKPRSDWCDDLLMFREIVGWEGAADA